MIKEGDLVYVKTATHDKKPLVLSGSIFEKEIGKVKIVGYVDNGDQIFREEYFGFWFHLCDVEKVFKD